MSAQSTTIAPDTKTHLLEIGYQLIAKKGFTAVGIKQILDTAGVPKGSFYHYFASKEAFGEAIISHYFTNYKARLDSIAHQNVDAQQKLYNYFQNWYDTQQNGCDHEKCLVVKLSAEVADMSEPMRIALNAGYQQTIAWLSEQIKAGWADNSVPQPENIAAESMAKRWYFAWLGASLIAKISQTNTPLAEVWQMTTSQMGR
ncbi:TetR family transcriptional regulator [Psychrobacter sp. AOP22-C1-22]|uniref:TetR/AcrR family transcriptional regulator n=1 Tax=unclassified Psychrobacter TaxID=196806 RepID=UPI001788A1D8|nr:MULTISPECIES: TetR/AcrR family transcriptional regulator [unclassified Psychrobacter]MDN5801831.1 TetR/AcrR family transcriptional regulator [Psychrobacter sp.]MBE0406836.1 TetR/AcrR family transcriptional regulator [Psychrobacter sp. FME6]MBE0445862.1 TetR/AcrR family transcriptional regulator [Psychrobacter sp. FME5]MDN5892019.1 TetR/AcrR family transcriptional regulator [Psychrobacter sp.]MDN5897939.1 TetR/AcrR family transcriptional regulator [Psychrobacter sp.]